MKEFAVCHVIYHSSLDRVLMLAAFPSAVFLYVNMVCNFQSWYYSLVQNRRRHYLESGTARPQTIFPAFLSTYDDLSYYPIALQYHSTLPYH